ncbi:glycosyltransferase family 9 protein [Pseudodesulfovibrio sediminis]|uniref:Heptosyltransferase n=1 Tax=Pseudodesulfovibrio sediminis TaxID=2810563 RepID=A0ABM7PAQ3_9BACT|nr:glycosyltransferase family 9 protein [Pseudodesulfovibrio sediminis]BCS90141.1 heptosyltransferase [Pseudodesulfovibrio sediminis]
MSTLDTFSHCVAIRLGHMGDVALTTGVLTHWHNTRGTTFTIVTKAGNAPLFDNHPAVSEVIGLSDAELKNKAWYVKAGKLADTYSNHALLDLHGSLRSRILALRWKGPVRRYPKFGLTRRLYDRTRWNLFRAKLEATTVPQRYAQALDDSPPPADELVPQIYLNSKEKTAAAAQLASIATAHPRVALHPYATHQAKEWPKEHWHELIELLDETGIGWFVIGRSKIPLNGLDQRDLTNATNLRETCALLDGADLLITGDSGPMHLACGVGTPVAALFGPTVKSWGFYPAGPKDQVIDQQLACRPCSLHGAKACDKGFECMTSITPEKMMRVATGILVSEMGLV